MTNKDLANVMYPNVTKTIYDYEVIYKERNLPEGAIVTRFAPSPTGFVHMGSLLTAFIASKMPKDTNGVFYLRIEDTDGKRTVENGISGILYDLKNFDIIPDEGVISETEEIGNYGPYIQSKRIDIYNTFAKYLVENDYAYPCFCTSEDLEDIRKFQEEKKDRIGYYGKYAKCRNISIEEKIKRIQNNEKYVLRLKSTGDYNKKITINDCVRGKIDFPENDIDHVLIKSDGIPVYHFAHVIDDHLMRTTHVFRGEEWLSSTPLHMELFNKLKFKVPKYAHLGLVMKIDEDGSRRKLSKRKDPEAAVEYYHKLGIPIEAVKLYLLTIANSNFEAWYDTNKGVDISKFKLDFKKISASGTLFDIEKLNNISKNYISRLTAKEVYDGLLTWTNEFDKDFYDLLVKYDEYSINVLNIERERKKPRKDYGSYSEIKKNIWYMYDELFNDSVYNNVELNENTNNEILLDYINNYYDELDDEETWYNKLKELAKKYNFASEVKEYKENPNNYNGHIGDICEFIRVITTSLTKTPSLYEILKLLGKDRIEKRINMIIESRN
ncbi:MAG: glutamate--tRNA ligase [Bacilli bacterium]|nr:glutamate--tRNA ligase [Bacilli bacterium]